MKLSEMMELRAKFEQEPLLDEMGGDRSTKLQGIRTEIANAQATRERALNRLQTEHGTTNLNILVASMGEAHDQLLKDAFGEEDVNAAIDAFMDEPGSHRYS